jgi:protein-disulfide isomerase
MKKSNRRLSLLTLALLVAAGLVVPGWAQAAGKGEQGSKVLATIGDHRITEAEVDQQARPQLAAIDNQIYQARKRALDQLIDEYLVTQAAKKAGLSEQEYVKREVEDKVPTPSDAEVEAFYKANQARIRQPLDKIKTPLINYMRNQKLQAAQEALLSKLRDEAKVNVLLEQPRVKVATQYSAGSLGPANAPVTMVEFSDFQCPFCQRSENSVKEVLKKYPNQVHFIYMDFPLSIHPNAMRASVAARCAADQGKFWQYHDALFADQSKLDIAGLKATAARLKLNTATFDTCLDKGEHVAEIQRSEQEGTRAGVDGTPTFFINGVPLNGAQPTSALEAQIASELSKSAKNNAARKTATAAD